MLFCLFTLNMKNWNNFCPHCFCFSFQLYMIMMYYFKNLKPKHI